MNNYKQYAFYLLFAAVIFAGQFLRTSDLVTGKPPVISQTTLGGIPAAPIIDKGPAMIYFWGEWCGVCAMIQPAINAVSTDYPLLGVALRSGTDGAVGQYLRQKQLAWQVINDPQGNIAQRYGVKVVPALFFIGADGDIVFTSVGYTSEWGLRLRLWLAGLV
ncbi:MAG: protein disulfide oxidoreductase [Methylococcaceae bacterium]|nr:protein disulfide oxidoreductase [Methylococcaceae bacterium]